MQNAPKIVRQLGRAARTVGQMLDRIGVGMQDNSAYVEKLVPSTKIVGFKGKEPKHGLQNFVASTASVVGDVALGEMSSAWYGATIRGDAASVSVGRNTSIMENALVAGTKGNPVVLGDDVTISAGAVVRGAHIGDGVMVGLGATILPGVRIGNDSFVDAGSVVPSGTTIGAGQLWTGAPARRLRALSQEEMSYLRSSAVSVGELGQAYYGQSTMTTDQVEFQAGVRLLKLENGMAPDAPLPVADADVLEYYKLTAPPPSSSLLRGDTEIDLKAELATREAIEIAADRAEEEFYNSQARLRRIGDAVKLLASTKPERIAVREKIVADLEARDPEGAAQLRGLVHAAGTATAGADAAAKANVMRALAATDFTLYANAEEAKAAIESSANALGAHAKFIGGSGPLSSPSSSSSGAGR